MAYDTFLSLDSTDILGQVTLSWGGRGTRLP